MKNGSADGIRVLLDDLEKLIRHAIDQVQESCWRDAVRGALDLLTKLENKQASILILLAGFRSTVPLLT